MATLPTNDIELTQWCLDPKLTDTQEIRKWIADSAPSLAKYITIGKSKGVMAGAGNFTISLCGHIIYYSHHGPIKELLLNCLYAGTLGDLNGDYHVGK